MVQFKQTFCDWEKTVKKNEEIIEQVSPHTIKKFELIEKYVEAWAHKLLQYPNCQGLVFIDCMCNSGEYVDDDGQQIFGTPVRVAKYLRNVAGQYPNKQIDVYFSDLSAARTDHLKSLMPSENHNFHFYITTEDGNDLAKRIGKSMDNNKHYLLVYDPYEACIDWEAILPFINNWSEVILNHMVLDSIRSIKIVKSDAARSKYEQTYLMDLESLLPYGSDKKAYEKRIEDIVRALRYRRSNRYYIAAFPFFNEKNSIMYNLIHCTSNINGFKLYKQSAWKTFDGKSSGKNTHGRENQLMLDFEEDGRAKTSTDEFCFNISDIAEYLQEAFNGRPDVPMDEIWALLDIHPVFPSDGFRTQIKNELKRSFSAKVGRSSVSFIDRS